MGKKHIVVIGLGGVGGYFGFKINQANEQSTSNTVSFIARDKTYEVVKEKGLTLLSPEHSNAITKPNAVYKNIGDLESPDLVLICVKEYDLERVCEQLKAVITKGTVVLPMMNGVTIYDRIRKILPKTIILPSCVYVASHIKNKGIVEHKGKAGKLFFGKDPEQNLAPIQWVVGLMEESGIDATFTEDISVEIWTKFIFVASFGLVTAKYNSAIGAVCSIDEQKIKAKNIMEEIRLIALKKGINLPMNIIAKSFEKAASFPPKTPTSLQLDHHSGKNNSELELFAGAIITYGKVLGIDTKNTSTIYAELKGNKL